MRFSVFLYYGVIILFVQFAAHGANASEGPWRLQAASGLPEWLTLGGTHRVRYETLNRQFRVTPNGSDQILVVRTTVAAGLHRGPFTIAGELMDSRAEFDDAGTPINTGIVNTADLLQGYLQWRGEPSYAPGSRFDVRIGRITMDVGSRRFVARNRYRNTINAFTGIDTQWRGASGRQLRAFFALPVNRKPNRAAELRENDVEFDEEDSEVKFWGLYFSDRFSWGDRGEIFYFGIDEDDSSGRPTRNRELTTLGLRLYRNPELSRFDYQVEAAVQFGESRSSVLATNVTALDHFAHFEHVELGYSFDRAWRPRLSAQYDHASGDRSPADGDRERFDTLYGARRFDFGPTGIYGPFARANIKTPGLRMQLEPGPRTTAFVAYRGFWLASDRDAWTTARVWDPSGNASSFVGQQVEARVRWTVRPSNVRIEAGMAHLFSGAFTDDAPNATGRGDVTYFYSQIAFWF